MNPDVEQIIDYLTNNQGVWRRKIEDEFNNFFASYLTIEARAWHHFISAKLLPSSNLSEVTKEQAILNFTIISRKKKIM